MSLTPDQIAQVRAAAGAPSPASSPTAPSLSARLGIAQTAPKVNSTSTYDPNNSFNQIIQKRGEGVYNAITGSSPESKGESSLTRGLQATGEAFGAITDVAGNVAKSLYEHLVPQDTQERIKNAKLGNQNSKAVADMFNRANDELGIRLNDFINAHPEVGKAVETALKQGKATGEISGGILTADATAKQATGLVNTAEKGINKVTSTAQNISNKATDYAGDSLKADWEKPTTINKPGFKKATEIYNSAADKGHNISETLVKNKINLADNVNQGNYSTLDTAENMRADAKKMSTDILRPSLEKADVLTPRTPTSEIFKGAVENIQNDKILTEEVKDSLIEKLDKTKAALEKKFPDGMSLTDMHDEKIVRDLNAKYSPVGDIATNAEAAKNKAMADSLRKLVETKAPGEIPVKEFNAELAKQYQAADYLESLNNKKVPVGIGSKIARTTAKVVGAAVGNGLGGGVLGGVGGYHIGGMLEGLLEDLPNPIKNSFLKNLETSNPEAFQKVQNYLSNLDTSGSVAQPMTSINKNITMPKSITDIEGKVKGFVDNPNLGLSTKDVTKNIPKADRSTLTQIIDDVRLNKDSTFKGGKEQVLRDYGINPDQQPAKVANDIENLLSKTGIEQPRDELGKFSAK